MKTFTKIAKIYFSPSSTTRKIVDEIANKFEGTQEEYDLLNCIECGSCVYTCPAKRNIVQYIKYAKAQNAAQNAKK